MKKIGSLLMISFLCLLLSACGGTKEEKQVVSEEVHPIQVTLTVPEAADVNETVRFEAVVTHGSENVEDADKVNFEIWEEGKKEDSVFIDATNKKNGLYIAETSFDRDGLFHVQVHVDARDQHTMPVKQITIGAGGEYETTENDAQDKEMNHDAKEDTGSHS